MANSVVTSETRRIAMLIDGDHAQPSLFGEMVAEASKYGTVTVRRIYGDWTAINMKSWKDTLNLYAIQPIQQFRYTTGKNATDSAMIIDAMDLLYEGVVQGFCLVSSDRDYTRLATRIREKGLFAMGIGERKTPKAFKNACEVFVETENLGGKTRRTELVTAPSEVTEEGGAPDPVSLIREAYEMSAQDDGWASLGVIGGHLRQLDPSFDPRTYGHKLLSQLVRAHSDQFEIRQERGRSGPATIYIRPLSRRG